MLSIILTWTGMTYGITMRFNLLFFCNEMFKVCSNVIESRQKLKQN